MQKIILITIGLLLTSLSYSQVASPELISSAGDNFSNATYQLDWSIGECVTATHSAGSSVITQGFHQDSYIITAIEDLATDINIFVYPNPTTNFVSLQIESSKVESMQYILTDINGKVLLNAEVLNNIEQFNFSAYTSGIYFLTVKQENQTIKSFKIIKN